MKRVCVVIINYKTPGLTLDCLHSLRGQIDSHKDHIAVVDNNSGGNDIEIITEGIGRDSLADMVTLVPSPENKGFSAGNNIGIRKIKARYYILANADTLFRPETISKLIQAAEKFPDAGIISPRLEWLDGEPQISCFRFHSPLSELINSAGTGIMTSLLKQYDVPLPVEDQVTQPEWTSFACVLIRREVFDRIGLMDEGYFMYFEDVDFCRRAQQFGFDIINYPFAHVIHLRGQSSGMKKLQKDKKRLPSYHYRSRARYYTQFYGRFGYLAANLCWLAGRTISFLRELLMGKDRTVPEYSYIDIWKN